MKNPSSILITDQDLERLGLLLQRTQSATEHPLEEELARADVVPQAEVPKDVVTMNSRVRFMTQNAEKESEITLVYPQDADASTGKISVLAPIGTALLGLRVGQEIDWALPNGKTTRLRVVGVQYQPEASGDWDL